MKAKKILFVDACPRIESRTRSLAKALLDKLGGEMEALNIVAEALPKMDHAGIIKRTVDCIAADFSSCEYRYAKQFATADVIVIAAPYWDLSFPACLKAYIETVSVADLTFKYSEEGIPNGLCKATDLYYVSTAGGPIVSDAYGYGYIEAMAKMMFGIKNCHKYYAENLDIAGNDVGAILANARKRMLESLEC